MKEPSKKTAKIKSRETRQTNVLPQPTRVDKFTSEEGTRMSRVIFGSAMSKCDYSVDEVFSRAIDSTIAFTTEQFWHPMLPWLENSQDQIDLFWKHFNVPAASERRLQAAQGRAITNHGGERSIVGLAKEIYGLRSPTETETLLFSKFKDPDQRRGIHDLGMIKLAEWVLEAVMNDHQAPRRLYDVLTSQPDPQRGKIGDIFNAFVSLVGKNERLPTKKQVRHAAGLGDDPEEYKTANKAYGKLGLSGLPEG